jgi:hypothetical protein
MLTEYRLSVHQSATIIMRGLGKVHSVNSTVKEDMAINIWNSMYLTGLGKGLDLDSQDLS